MMHLSSANAIHKIPRRRLRSCGVVARLALAWVMVLAQTLPLYANPVDGVVSAGDANISSAGNTLTVTQASDKAVIDWRGFDIAHGETTNFVQPNASSMTLNRVNSNSASFIDGNLTANGNLIVVNPNGVWFGAGARVDVNSLIATTAGISNDAFMNSAGKLVFDQPGNPNAGVVNEGWITAKEAGLVGLVAPNVVNNGVIVAKMGRVHLASGDTATVDLYGDGLMDVAVSDAVTSQLVENNGIIAAEGGTIAMTAAAGKDIVNSLVKVSGELHAPSIKQKNGKIIIAAEGSNAVKNNIAAHKGKKTGTSTVIVDGVLNASGRKAGERGGSVQITGDNIALLDGTMIDASGSDGLSGTTFNKAVSAYRDGSAGGDIRIGGDYLGQGDTATAKNLYVDKGVLVLNDALNSGDAGRTIFWSDDTTSFYGNVYARALGGKPIDVNTWNATSGGNTGDGGFIETSGHGHLDAGGYVDLTASNGERGTYFLDPTDITIYGNFAPNYATVVQGDSTALSANLKVWLDASDTANVNLTYNTLGTTASGTSGTNTITVSSNAGLTVGARIRLGGAGSVTAASTLGSDTYTITNIAGTTITLSSNLTTTYTTSSIFQGYVSQLTDKSGSGSSASNATPANMPLWISNGQNGIGVASFNGTNRLDAVGVTTGTTFISGQRSDAANNFYEVTANVLSNQRGAGFASGASQIYYVYEQSYLNSLAKAYNDTTGTLATQMIYTGYDTDLRANQTLSFGYATPSFSRLSGRLNEVIDYNVNLSTNARNLVEQYQSNKWGIALTPPGSGATEAAQATASIQKGDGADGYSVFTTRYLERLSQSANISLQSSNNITLDLQGDTLNFATSGRTLSLTAGNQISTASTGTITTNNGAISLTGTNGININHAFTINSGSAATTLTTNNAAINVNAALNVNGATTLSAGTGTITTAATITNTNNLTLKSDNMTIGASLAGTGALYIAPGTNSRTLNFGTATGALDWNTTEISYIGANKQMYLGIWGTTTGNVDIGGFSLNNNMAIYNMGNLTVSAPVNFMGKTLDVGLGTGTVNINAALTSVGGNLTLRSGMGGVSIGLAGAAGNMAISSAMLDNITDGWNSITFGNGSGQNIVMNAYSNWRDPVVFNSGSASSATITVSGAQSTAAGSNARFTFSGPTTFNADVNTTNSTASAGIGTITLGNYAHTLSANIITGDANITTNGTINVTTGNRRIYAGTGILTTNNTITGVGNISLNANDFNINADITTADIQIRPTNNSTIMGLAGAAGAAQLSTVELDYLKPTSSLTIGSSSVIGAWFGTLNFGAYTWNQAPSGSIIFRADVAMNLTGAQSFGAAGTYGVRYYANSFAISGALSTASARTLGFTGASVTLDVGQGVAAAGIDSAELDLISNGWSGLSFGGETPTTNLYQYSNWRDPVTVQANGTLTILGAQTAAAGSNTSFTVNLGYSAGGSTNINADIDMRPATGGTGSITLSGATHYGQGSAHLISANLYSGSGGINIDKTVTSTGASGAYQYFNAGTGTITITDNGTNRRGSVSGTNQYLRFQADDFAIGGAITGTSNGWAWFETNTTSRSMGIAGATGQAQLSNTELDLVTGWGRVDLTSGTGGTNVNSRTWPSSTTYFFNSTGLVSILQNQSFTGSSVFFQGLDYNIVGNLTQVGGGSLNFPTQSNTGGLTIGGAAGTTMLDSTELDKFTDGWAGITFGFGQVNDIILQAYNNWRDPVNFSNSGNLTVSGAQSVTAASNASFTFDQRGANRNTAINANIETSQGSGGITFVATSGANSNVQLGANLISGNGITINRTINLTGAAGTTRTMNAGSGTVTTSSAGIIAAADKNLKIIADDVSLNGSISGNGTLTFNPYTSSRTMNIGAGSGGMNFSSAELGLFTDGFSSIIFDSNNGNSNVVMGTNNWLDNLLVTTKNANISLVGTNSSTASGDAIILTTTGSFTNSSGALSTPSGRWLVYSTSPLNDTTTGLNRNFHRFNCAYGGACAAFPASGNGLLYSSTPMLTATAVSVTLTYGDAGPAINSYAYNLTGYVGDDAAADSISGALNGMTAYTQGASVGTYALNYASGSLASTLGYSVSYANNASAITVVPRAFTVAADNIRKLYGTQDPALSFSITGLSSGDAANALSGNLGRVQGAQLGTYAILQNTLATTANYIMRYVPGKFVIYEKDIPVTVTRVSQNPKLNMSTGIDTPSISVTNDVGSTPSAPAPDVTVDNQIQTHERDSSNQPMGKGWLRIDPELLRQLNITYNFAQLMGMSIGH